jgi:hypothetical protein
MRCYFLRDGHIAAVEELPGLSDAEAIAKARILFSEREHLFETVEVWERTRIVFRYPPVAQEPAETGGGPPS